jgi:hypothetical protein
MKKWLKKQWRSIWKRISLILKPEWAGWLEYTFERNFLQEHKPMNGQGARLTLTKEIIKSCHIERIIETGTFRGTTTEWFAQFGLPVLSCEINRRHARFSSLRLQSITNVTMVQCSSIDFLGGLVKRNDHLSMPTMFYLDSHWYRHLPLDEELVLVLDNFTKAIVIVDDFAVPDDPGYKYDDYGPNKRLSLDYVIALKLPRLFIYFPSMPSAQESGARRGCVVITANATMAAVLNRLPALRSWKT